MKEKSRNRKLFYSSTFFALTLNTVIYGNFCIYVKPSRYRIFKFCTDLSIKVCCIDAAWIKSNQPIRAINARLNLPIISWELLDCRLLKIWQKIYDRVVFFQTLKKKFWINFFISFERCCWDELKIETSAMIHFWKTMGEHRLAYRPIDRIYAWFIFVLL